MLSVFKGKFFQLAIKAGSISLPCCSSLHPSVVPLLKRDNSHSPFSPPPQSAKKISKLARKDKIGGDFELVYQSPIANFLGLAQLSSLVVATGLAALAIAFPDAGIQPSDDYVFGPQTGFEGKFAFASLFLTAATFQYLSFKNPLRIYTDGETFIMIMGHALLGPYAVGRKLQFTAGSAKMDVPFKLSPWNSVRYDINGKKYFIYENHFRTNADYLSMLGLK